MQAIELKRLWATLTVVGSGVFACAIAAPALAQGLPVDWSHRHVIYSNPDTEEEAAAKGRLDEWNRMADDPRFILQLERKEAQAATRHTSADGADRKAGAGLTDGRLTALGKKQVPAPTWSQIPEWMRKRPAPTGVQIDRDWSNVMGGASGSGNARTYPAKFAFGIDAKDCASDFVVFATSAAGATGSGQQAFGFGQFSNAAAPGDTVTITNGTRSLTLTASSTVNTGLFFLPGGSANASAANLAAAINRNGGSVGVTATNPLGAFVQVTAITHGAGGNSITLAENSGNFGLFFGGALVNGSGTAGQPTIFALNQLYADTANGGCQTSTQPVPAPYWSYNTGIGAVADLSPVLSFYDNGAQVAFMQRSGAVSSLVLLKWSSSSQVGTVGAPTAPTSVTAGNYRTCTAPCMTILTLSGNPNNTNSSPYVDYTGDIIYVGDDTGKVHKFSGVFQGTPAEVGAPWPVQVAAATSIMSSPIFDGSSTVYIGSNGPALATGNRLHRVNTTSGAVTSSGAIGSSSSANGVRDAPILDTSSGKVYAFQGAFTSAATDSLGSSCGGTCNTVFQFATNFAAASTGSSVYVGLSATANNLNASMSSGAFDDAYYSSGGTSGALYVCGSSTGSASRPTLWKLTIASGIFSSRTAGPLLVSADSTPDGCSPVTVFKNGSAENLFVGVHSNGAAAGGGGCTSPAAGCIYMYDITPPLVWSTTKSASAALNASGGTGGIIIDNTVTGGGSQVYYSTRTSPGNAVQASQAGLN